MVIAERRSFFHKKSLKFSFTNPTMPKISCFLLYKWAPEYIEWPNKQYSKTIRFVSPSGKERKQNVIPFYCKFCCFWQMKKKTTFCPIWATRRFPSHSYFGFAVRNLVVEKSGKKSFLLLFSRHVSPQNLWTTDSFGTRKHKISYTKFVILWRKEGFYNCGISLIIGSCHIFITKTAKEPPFFIQNFSKNTRRIKLRITKPIDGSTTADQCSHCEGRQWAGSLESQAEEAFFRKNVKKKRKKENTFHFVRRITFWKKKKRK